MHVLKNCSMAFVLLDRRGFDPRYLSAAESDRGTCSYSYDFEGQGQKLNYVVMSTWLHGDKLTFWDYKREEEEQRVAKRMRAPSRK